MAKGIDISQWQGNIDFSKVKSQVDFVILREGYRKASDSKFFEYVQGCKENQIPIKGIYHFVYALNNQDVIAEAESCLANIEKAGLTKDVVIWCDLEGDSVAKAAQQGVTLGKNEIDLFTRTFCEFFTKRGYLTGIYTNLNYYKNMYSAETVGKYPIWLADYSGDPDYACAYHQYSSSGNIDGINGFVDMDYCYTDLSAAEEEEMSKTEMAVVWMESMATDNAHGYDQTYRWGQKGDYDCSSAVITAWELAGVPVKTAGATYTGNMYKIFLGNGFKDVTASVNLSTGSGLQRGDVLLNHVHHVAMYCGNGKEVEASINEKGTATGGTPGDQTGKEFLIRSYRNYPWNVVLRYDGEASANTVQTSAPTTSASTVSTNSKEIIAAGQQHSINFTGIKISVDGVAGTETNKQKVRVLQTALNLDYKSGLTVDGVYGSRTKAALGSHYVQLGEKQYMVTACEILLMLNGYNPIGVELPGTFGSGCKAAVLSFQKAKGLTASGICDAETFKALIK